MFTQQAPLRGGVDIPLPPLPPRGTGTFPSGTHRPSGYTGSRSPYWALPCNTPGAAAHIPGRAAYPAGRRPAASQISDAVFPHKPHVPADSTSRSGYGARRSTPADTAPAADGQWFSWPQPPFPDHSTILGFIRRGLSRTMRNAKTASRLVNSPRIGQRDLFIPSLTAFL